MAKIHIGKKIKEVVDKSSFTVVDFAAKINLTRDAVYKIFTKDSVDADQLQKISKVLNHDFFSYYQNELSLAAEKNSPYGFATKKEVEAIGESVKSLTLVVHSLVKEVERLRDKPTKKPVSKSKKKK